MRLSPVIRLNICLPPAGHPGNPGVGPLQAETGRKRTASNTAARRRSGGRRAAGGGCFNGGFPSGGGFGGSDERPRRRHHLSQHRGKCAGGFSVSIRNSRAERGYWKAGNSKVDNGWKKRRRVSLPLRQDGPCSTEPGINPAPFLNAERLPVVPRRATCTSKGAICWQLRRRVLDWKSGNLGKWRRRLAATLMGRRGRWGF